MDACAAEGKNSHCYNVMGADTVLGHFQNLQRENSLTLHRSDGTHVDLFANQLANLTQGMLVRNGSW